MQNSLERRQPQWEDILKRSQLQGKAIDMVNELTATTDHIHLQILLQRFCSFIREPLTRIIRVLVNDSQWLQAHVPVSKEGIELRVSAALHHAPTAYTFLLSNVVGVIIRVAQCSTA